MKKVVMFAPKETANIEAKSFFARQDILLEFAGVLVEADAVVDACKGADAVISLYTPFPKTVIKRLDPTVKAIVRSAMGYDIIDVEAASARGIYVCNVPDYAMQEVAVHQVALMLAALRKVCAYNDAMHVGKWNDIGDAGKYPVRRLSTLKYGLLGFGRIARLVAQYIKGFGTSVYVYDPYLPDEVFRKCGVTRVNTPDEIFAVCDLISPNIPLTEASKHIINAQSIAQMKDGVILINTGRGALIDEAALVEGLRNGKIQAAALDVFEEEPLVDRNHPLMQVDNVILTPHIAYFSVEAQAELVQKTFANAIQAANGLVPDGAVNKQSVGGRV